VFIDLETRSACDLEEEGGRRYAAHPTTEVISVAALIDQRVILWTPTLPQALAHESLWPEGFEPARPVETFAGTDLPRPLEEAIAAGRPFCAHNALQFDAHVWRARAWPEPSAWIDTKAEARAAGWPGALGKLGLRLFGRGKVKDGTKLVQQYCRPTKPGDFRPFGSEAATRMARYNLADVLLLVRVHDAVRGHAEPGVLALDSVINGRGISFDADLAESLMRLEEQEAQAAGEEVERLTDGAVKPADLRRVLWLKGWLKDRGVEVADLQQETLEGVLRAHRDLKAPTRRVIEARLAAGRVATSKLARALATRHDDGRLRDLLVYHGCHTGRWTGKGVQPQNLPKPHDDIKDPPSLLGAVQNLAQFKAVLPAGVSVADGLSSLVRLCFRAESGKVLLIADYAGIEARGVAWCAGERRLLDLFAAGGDSYCDFAGTLFGRTITRAMKRERRVGKEAVLGCGYGMSPPTFAERCAAKRVDLAAAGVTAEEVVEGYRDAYSAIAGTRVDYGTFSRREGGLWQCVGGAAFSAVAHDVFGSAGRCVFYREQDALIIRLPSGRQLRYRNARIEDRVPGYCRALNLPERPKPTLVYDGPDTPGITTYGAKLVENIVQAICRDLLVAALLECERQRLPVVLHVHDEVVVEVPAAGAEEVLRRLVVIMSTPPAWAEGFPVEVEGFVSDRYLKSAPEGAAVVKARNGQLLGES
jgi:DNA polymerase